MTHALFQVDNDTDVDVYRAKGRNGKIYEVRSCTFLEQKYIIDRLVFVRIIYMYLCLHISSFFVHRFVKFVQMITYSSVYFVDNFYKTIYLY